MRRWLTTLVMAVLVATAASAQTLYVPAAANAEGSNQTRWRSDLQVKARGSEGATFTVELLEHGADNSDPQIVERTVAAGESLRLSNLLETEFGFTGTAALRLTATAGQFVVTSRTFNDDPSGTYGQTVPAVPVEQATLFGDQVSLIQLSRSADTTVGFRSNIGVVNTTGATITVEIDLYHADATFVGTLTVELQPYDYQQVNDVFAHAGALDVADGYAVVRTTTAGGAFIAYASVVDNRSGDAVLVATAASAQILYVPASANAEGANQTRWRSDLQVKARGGEGATFTVELLEHGADNSDPQIVERTVAAGESLRLANLLETEFGFTGTAALRLTAIAGQIVVTSRTFNDDPSGTYGQTVPAVPAEQTKVFGDQVSLIQLSRSADPSAGFRTNIGCVNTTGETITVEIDLYLADGTFVGTLTVELQPYDYRQVNDVFAHAGAEDVADGYAVVRTTTGGGAFIAYASVVDNRSGDAVLLLAQPDEVEVAPEPQERLVVFEVFMRPG